MADDWPQDDKDGTYTVTVEWRKRRSYEDEDGTPRAGFWSQARAVSAGAALAVLRVVDADAQENAARDPLAEVDAQHPDEGSTDAPGDHPTPEQDSTGAGA
jgi:hypothetical protein